MHLLHDLRPMSLDRALRDSEFRGNVLVEFTRDHEREDGSLASRQRLESRMQLAHPFSGGSVLNIFCQRALDRCQQRLPLHWFGEKINGAGFHGSDTHRNIAMTCEKDDGESVVLLVDRCLEVKTTRAGHAHVQQYAAGCVLWLRKQERSR